MCTRQPGRNGNFSPGKNVARGEITISPRVTSAHDDFTEKKMKRYRNLLMAIAYTYRLMQEYFFPLGNTYNVLKLICTCIAFQLRKLLGCNRVQRYRLKIEPWFLWNITGNLSKTISWWSFEVFLSIKEPKKKGKS